MSYQDIRDGLRLRLATVNGIRVILEHEPVAVQDSPMIYSILDGFERDTVGTTTTTIWRTTHTLLVSYHDPAEAERLLRAFADTIPQAIVGDPRLGGTCKACDITVGEAGWTKVGDAPVFRSLDFTSEAKEVSPYYTG